ncbi:MAG: ABC transporter permease subunit [Gammaproteobacteria bacterium]|nr:ABC transporter permease subunit [Gammaproteobacteria bacterium]
MVRNMALSEGAVIDARAPGEGLRAHRWLIAWGGMLGLTLALYLGRDALPWLWQYPRAWDLPLRFWISDFMKWLVNDFDLGLFTFKELTRSISWLLQWPLDAAQGLLAAGFRVAGEGEGAVTLPRLSWLGIIAVVVALGWMARGPGLAALVGACFAYLAVFGQWDSAMVTLASIVIAVPIGVAAGLLVGIACFRHPRVELVVTPLLDLMQTVPVFAYLVPVLFLFGFGPVAAMIATIIFATPPMVRCTLLGLRTVPTEVVEFGSMAGCSPRQLLWKVQIPSARPTLMVGVNQVIMMSLNMVIIASMIGAGGLGFDVLSSLKRLQIGEGVEAGLAITLLAIALDRLSQGFANRPPPEHDQVARGFWQRHPHLAVALAILAASTLLGVFLPALETYPESLTITTRSYWNELVSWINVNFFDQLDAVKSWLLLHALIPVKRFMLALPWIGVVGMVGLAGLQLGGWRLALLCASLAAFMAVTGNWEKSMTSVYLCGISVIIAALIGVPIGIYAALDERAHRIVQVIIDTLQTLPSFVYLIPVVMLFRVGDFSAMIAIVAYALAPAVRYTDLGIRQVRADVVEAARAMGCTRRQILWRVQLPVAMPEIMLGINQTIMLALAMLVITALVGTRDLGQEVYIALTKADTGRGIVAGVCVAFIAIIADRLIAAWARAKKRELGIA